MQHKNILAILMGVLTLTLVGCASVKSKPVPFVPGVDTTSVWIFESEDGAGVVLDGNVSRGIDSVIIEEYLETEYGMNVVSNRITAR